MRMYEIPNSRTRLQSLDAADHRHTAVRGYPLTPTCSRYRLIRYSQSAQGLKLVEDPVWEGGQPVGV